MVHNSSILLSGAWVKITVEAAIDNTAEEPVLPNEATASSDIYDPNIGNNSDDANIGPPPTT